MLSRLSLAPALALAAIPVTAQADVPFEPAIVAACLSSASAPVRCIGDGAAACIAVQDGQGAGVCYGAETVYWEDRVAGATAALQSHAPAAGAVAALVGAASAFAEYRIAACDAAMAVRPGMPPGPIRAECRMRITAEHALRLETWLEALE